MQRGLEKGYLDANAIKKAVGEGWIQVNKVSRQYTDQVMAIENRIGIRLGAGERETLALALETSSDVVLTNDEDACDLASILEIRSKGVLYLLLKSVKDGYLPKNKAKEYMGKMLDEGFWLSPSIVHAFHEALDEL